MNIIFPLGGLRRRRDDESSHGMAKPFMNILGRPMLFMVIDHLMLNVKEDIIIIVVRDYMDHEFQISAKIAHEFPNIDIRVVKLYYQTYGAAETVLGGVNCLSSTELSRRTVVMGYEVVYFTDILSPIRNLPRGENATLFFVDDAQRPVYSYVTFKEKWQPPLNTENGSKLESCDSVNCEVDVVSSNSWPVVNEVREKVMISHFANLGTYVFDSGEVLVTHVRGLLADTSCTKDDLYMSSVQRAVLKSGGVIRGFFVQRYAQLFTTAQMLEFFELVEKQGFRVRKPLRLCFTLDGTLLTHPLVPNDYSTCKPLWNTIKLARVLHRLGHTILIQTCRDCAVASNFGDGMKRVGPLTFRQLDEYDIPYDEIYFGQPVADVLVDGTAINSQIDAAKQLGWMEQEDTQNVLKESNMIKCRDFNVIQIYEDSVKKSGPFETMVGEQYFYEHMPADIAHLFPKFVGCRETADGGRSITLSRVRGIPFGLLVLNMNVTVERLQRLLVSLSDIHCSKDACKSALPREQVSMYCNYANKVQARYQKYRDVYDLYEGSNEIYERILSGLQDYENEDRGVYCECIHGDPVFTNIICDLGSVYFLDMRGMLGSVCTLQGDVTYDLAKLYQSLCGYEVLLKQLPLERYEPQLSNLRAVFWKHVQHQYPSVKQQDVKMITISLIFSFIPLHNPADGYLDAIWQWCREMDL